MSTKKVSYWGEVDPSDYDGPSLTDGEQGETPEEVVEESLEEMSKEVNPILRGMNNFFKKMGWKVKVSKIEEGFGIYETDTLTIAYEFELEVRGGQKLILDRKRWVSDGTYRPSFALQFDSDTHLEAVEGEPGETQLDVDDFDYYATWYEQPSSNLDNFQLFDGDGSSRIYHKKWKAKEVEEFCREWVLWYLSKEGSGSRSKWKKKRAMIERVATRHQKKGMGKIDGNFKKVSPLIGSWFEGLITKLASIENSLGYAEQIATREHKRLEALVERKYGYSDNFQDADYEDPLVQAFLWVDEFWGQVYTGKYQDLNTFQKKVGEAKRSLESTIYHINGWGRVESRMATDKNANVAKTIIKQLGGANRLKAMIGASNFLDGGKYVSFRFPLKRSKAFCRITLTSMDLYDMEIFTIRRPRSQKITVTEEMVAENPSMARMLGQTFTLPSDKPDIKKSIATHKGIYFDQLIELFEQATGLYLRL